MERKVAQRRQEITQYMANLFAEEVRRVNQGLKDKGVVIESFERIIPGLKENGTMAQRKIMHMHQPNNPNETAPETYNAYHEAWSEVRKVLYNGFESLNLEQLETAYSAIVRIKELTLSLENSASEIVRNKAVSNEGLKSMVDNATSITSFTDFLRSFEDELKSSIRPSQP